MLELCFIGLAKQAQQSSLVRHKNQPTKQFEMFKSNPNS